MPLLPLKHLLGAGLPTLASLALLLAGCQKESACENPSACITLTGRVVSEQNGQSPVADAAIELSSLDNSQGFFGGPEVPIDRTTTDAQGNYRLQFRPTAQMLERGNYRLRYLKQGYGLFSGRDARYENRSYKPGQTYVQDLFLARWGGQLRVVITGFPGASASNTTYTTAFYPFYRGQGGVTVRLTIPGTDQDARTNLTEAVGETAANQHTIIEIGKTKDGVRSFVRDSIYCPLNQLVTYTHAF